MTGALLLLATLAPVTVAADTVVQLRAGDRVVVENFSGELTVVARDGDRMEVEVEGGTRALVVRRSGSVVQVLPGERRRRRRSRDVVLRVPTWVELEVRGTSFDLTAAGLDGDLVVGNVSGDISIENVSGRLDVSSIDGEIDIRNAGSDVRASSQSDDVTVIGVTGAVDVHSGSGDIVLDDVTSESVRAETQDGDIDFNGTIADGGSYGFYVHDGDALIAVQPSMNARVSVSTFDGEFESEFPVVVERFTAGRMFEFMLGDGSARLEIEVFDGEIRLLQRR